ncbi:MAG: methylated-DNA--[protein]-cysteine S-methyltransferase [Candidatus Poribacteria bacterium]|nr:methylated-DNA--[protein]-cysteine S-methyltransferase [Candidatus Poribacteria bacterium]
MNYTCFKSPFGWVSVARSERGVARVSFGASTETDAENLLLGEIEATKSDAGLSEVVDLLTRYFNGNPVDFSLNLDLETGTAFRKRVWQAARQIPHGEVRTYGWIAQQIHRSKSARAVGGAMGANPLPIIVPCHRVIRSDGGLGGYSGGLHWKQRLLTLERVR